MYLLLISTSQIAYILCFNLYLEIDLTGERVPEDEDHNHCVARWTNKKDDQKYEATVTPCPEEVSHVQCP